MNPGSSPSYTFNIMVFDESEHFASAEAASFLPQADDRPCPHDDDDKPEGEDDGTWWSPFEGIYVCHHR